jgi:hypothetical protein
MTVGGYPIEVRISRLVRASPVTISLAGLEELARLAGLEELAGLAGLEELAGLAGLAGLEAPEAKR